VKFSIRIRPANTGFAFCDEAYTNDRFFVLGAVLFAAEGPKNAAKVVEAQEDEINAIKSEYGLEGRVKWSKVPTKPGKKLEGYKAVLRFFLKQKSYFFKCMIVDTHANPLGNRKLWSGDPLIGYLKFYSVFLADGLMQRFPNYYYDITIDAYTFRDDNDCKTLERSIEGRYIRKAGPQAALSHCRLRACDEESSQLLQLTDLLVGAVGFSWNGGKERTTARAATRKQLVTLIEEELNLNLSDPTPWSKLKFNIWLLRPNPRQAQKVEQVIAIDPTSSL
jgi:hypothetical protein